MVAAVSSDGGDVSAENGGPSFQAKAKTNKGDTSRENDVPPSQRKSMNPNDVVGAERSRGIKRSSGSSSSSVGDTGRRGTESSPIPSANKKARSDENAGVTVTSLGSSKNNGSGGSSSSKDGRSSIGSVSASGIRQPTVQKAVESPSKAVVVKRSSTSEVDTAKAHYPRIEYDPRSSKVLNSSKSNSKSPSSSATTTVPTKPSHKSIIVQLMKEICAVESNGLKEYGAADKERDSIISALRDVLADLPEKVAEGIADEIVCQPELTTVEKDDLTSIEQTLTLLRDQSASLSKYQQDITALGKDFNLWMDGKDAEKAISGSNSGARQVTISSPLIQSNPSQC